MAVAILYPEAEKGGRGKKGSQSKRAAEIAGVSHRRVQQARQVFGFSRELAAAVRDGAKKLDEALEEATTAQERIESDEEKLARLTAEAPDLTELVREERLPHEA